MSALVESSGAKAAFVAVVAGLEAGGGYGVRLRDLWDVQAQALIEEQRTNVPSGPMFPATGMTATKRGESGPYPWWQPVT